MQCTQEDYQQALRLSQAIQQYFRLNYNKYTEGTGEMYAYLVKHDLAEPRPDGATPLVQLLGRLKAAGDLSWLLPQCQPGVAGKDEWRFIRMVDDRVEQIRQQGDKGPGKELE